MINNHQCISWTASYVLSQYKLKTFIVDGIVSKTNNVTIILIFGVYEYYTVGLYFIENTVIATQEWYSTQKQRIGSLVFI